MECDINWLYNLVRSQNLNSLAHVTRHNGLGKTRMHRMVEAEKSQDKDGRRTAHIIWYDDDNKWSVGPRRTSIDFARIFRQWRPEEDVLSGEEDIIRPSVSTVSV